MNVRAAIFVVFLVLLGCSTTLQFTKPNELGYFPTSYKLDIDSVKVNKPFLEKYRNMVYILNNPNYEQYNNFLAESLKATRVFSRVLTKNELESLVIQLNLSNKISNVDDLIALNKLQKQEKREGQPRRRPTSSLRLPGF